MRNYKLTISYDGSRYQGWQRQPDVTNTIQGILESSIGKVVGYPVEVNGSGRTDGGVHAYAQMASVQIAGKVKEQVFRDRINEKLPEDIRIRKVELVKNSFHARKNAVSKCYQYQIDTSEKGNVFQRKYCWKLPGILDVKTMKEAAGYLVGRHDYLAFCDRKEEEGKSTVRTIYDIQIKESGELLTITYLGSGFLYHMVRILTGTLVEVGKGERKPEEMQTLFKDKARYEAGMLAPAEGLFLKKVYYEEKGER